MFVLAPVDCSDLQGVIVIVKFVLGVIQWIVPIILILLGTIDLVKAVIAGKEEDIKKNQQVLIKRVIAAVIVFLIPLIVGILMGMIGQDKWRTCWGEAKGSVKDLFDSDKALSPADK